MEKGGWALIKSMTPIVIVMIVFNFTLVGIGALIMRPKCLMNQPLNPLLKLQACGASSRSCVKP